MLDSLKGYVIPVLLAVLGAFGVYHWVVVMAMKADISFKKAEITRLEASVEALNQGLTTCKNANTELSKAVDGQNLAVNSLKEETRKREEASKKAVEKAERDSVEWKKSFQNLLDANPVKPGHECESLDALLTRYLGGAK